MNLRKWIGAAIAGALLALVVGCSGDTAAVAPADTEVVPQTTDGRAPENSSPDDVTPEDAAPEVSAPEAANSVPESDSKKNNIEVASPQTEVIDPAETDLYLNEEDRAWMDMVEAGIEEDRRIYDVSGSFDPDSLTLMGLSVGTPSATVTQQFGNPSETFELPDEAVTASVLAYPGFMVGVKNDKVLFVEVNTRSVNPGLNGLRLGDTTEQAVELLGKPSSSTEFVMNYSSGGAILKLDIDPETNKIHSLKLFPEE